MSDSFLAGKESIGAEIRNKLSCMQLYIDMIDFNNAKEMKALLKKEIDYIKEISCLPELSNIPQESIIFKRIKYIERQEVK